MTERILIEVNAKSVHYGDYVFKIRDLFSRKQESISKQDDKFFSKYWQVYAWSAIIGFVYNKRIENAKLQHKTSFEYQMITNGSVTISNGLLLMAISKVNSNNIDEILDVRNLLTIISEYAEGGAKFILEIRQTPGQEGKFNFADDYFFELTERPGVNILEETIDI